MVKRYFANMQEGEDDEEYLDDEDEEKGSEFPEEEEEDHFNEKQFKDDWGEDPPELSPEVIDEIVKRYFANMQEGEDDDEYLDDEDEKDSERRDDPMPQILGVTAEPLLESQGAPLEQQEGLQEKHEIHGGVEELCASSLE